MSTLLVHLWTESCLDDMELAMYFFSETLGDVLCATRSPTKTEFVLHVHEADEDLYPFGGVTDWLAREWADLFPLEADRLRSGVWLGTEENMGLLLDSCFENDSVDWSMELEDAQDQDAAAVEYMQEVLAGEGTPKDLAPSA